MNKFIDFLNYGAIGLGLALAILTFRLLSVEQKREDVRSKMLSSIYVFMAMEGDAFFSTAKELKKKSSISFLFRVWGSFLEIIN